MKWQQPLGRFIVATWKDPRPDLELGWDLPWGNGADDAATELGRC